MRKTIMLSRPYIFPNTFSYETKLSKNAGRGEKSAHHQRSHTRNLQDHTVKPQELEDGEVWVRRRVANRGDLDDARRDGEYEVEDVRARDEEVAPVGQLREYADDDLEVEHEREDKLRLLEDLRVRCGHGVCARCLQDERRERERDPAPPDALVHLLQKVAPRKNDELLRGRRLFLGHLCGQPAARSAVRALHR
jgi:hypothetical protein